MNKEIVTNTCKHIYENVIKSLPENLRFIKDDCFIAGGSIVSLFQEQPIKDIDVYFRTASVRDKFVKLAKLNYIFEKTVNCFQIKSEILFKEIQFIVTFTDNPENIIESFDFMHCKVAYDPLTNNIVIGKDKRRTDTMRCIHKKILSLNPGCKYPIRAIERLARFSGRGYKLENGFTLELVPLLFSLNVIDEKVLQEQLNGLYGSTNDSAKKMSKDLHSSSFNNKMDTLIRGDS